MYCAFFKTKYLPSFFNNILVLFMLFPEWKSEESTQFKTLTEILNKISFTVFYFILNISILNFFLCDNSIK